MGITPLRIDYKCSWQNGVVERFILTLKLEIELSEIWEAFFELGKTFACHLILACCKRDDFCYRISWTPQ